MGDAVSPGVGTRFDDAARNDAHQHRRSAAVPAIAIFDHVPAFDECVKCSARDTFIEKQIAQVPGVIVEARDQVTGLKTRRFNGRLGVHVELDHVEQQLQQALILIVAARGRQREIGRTILLRD